MKILRILSDSRGDPKSVDVRLEIGEEYKGPRYSEGYEDGYRVGFEKGRNLVYEKNVVTPK